MKDPIPSTSKTRKLVPRDGEMCTWRACSLPALLMLLVCTLLPMQQGLAQDVHFSQFRMTPVFLNPSTAGAFSGDFRGQLNYRQQWQSFADAYRTYAFSGDGKLFADKWDDSHLGVGAFAYSDQAGDAGFGVTRGKIAVSYGMAISANQWISAGLQGSYDQWSVNRGDLEWGNQYDGSGHNSELPSYEEGLSGSSTAWDVGGGLSWRLFSDDAAMASNKGYWVQAGAAVHHAAEPDHSFYTGTSHTTDMKFVAHANGSYGLDREGDLAVLPGLMFALQGPNTELLYGGLVRYHFKKESHFTGLNKGTALSLGLHHRFGDAAIATTMFELGKYALGFSYDINLSGLRTASRGMGGFEVSFRMVTPDPFVSSSRPAKPRY